MGRAQVAYNYSDEQSSILGEGIWLPKETVEGLQAAAREKGNEGINVISLEQSENSVKVKVTGAEDLGKLWAAADRIEREGADHERL